MLQPSGEGQYFRCELGIRLLWILSIPAFCACADPLLPSDPFCGDGFVIEPEECDDGPENADDRGCTSACAEAVCGDGLVYVGIEECDDGTLNGPSALCTSECGRAYCGDGLVLSGVEECDDGEDNSDSAMCTSACSIAVCGDGFVLQGVEECDEGTKNGPSSTCSDNCRLTICGDGALNIGTEECDDGNTRGADGCSPSCRLPRTLPFDLIASRIRVPSLTYVQPAGDIDSDGRQDLLLSSNVETHLFLGSASSGTLELSEARASYSALFGQGLKDLNSDGNDDFVLLSLFPDSSYDLSLFYGSANSGLLPNVSLPAAPFPLLTFPFVASGDVTGDGIDDFVLTTLGGGPGEGFVGNSYTVPGPIVEPLDLSDLLGFQIVGDSGRASIAMAAGDFNGDGDTDVVVREPSATGSAVTGGAPFRARIFSGPFPNAASIPVASADATIVGGTDEDFGYSMARGDFNDDGFDDLAISTLDSEADRDFQLFYGPLAGSRLSGLADATRTGGIDSLATGDINGDGNGDVVAFGTSPAPGQRWEVYVLFGPLEQNHPLSLADVTIEGQAEEDFIVSGGVGTVVDYDGDGFDDVIFGTDAEGGTVYIVSGATL